MLAAENLSFRYRRRAVLTGASLSLTCGEFVCLLGVNGAGKSTLLKMLLGLQRPHQGTVRLDNTLLTNWNRRRLAQRIAYVPQLHVAPFPYTVRQVALLGRMPATGMFRNPSAEDQRHVQDALEQLGIAHLADQPYTQVSGGERQLTLIARALAQQARLLIMDEPLAGLDYGNQIRLLCQLEQLVADGYGVLMTTHDPNQPLSGCQRVALLMDGRIAADGKPDQILTPSMIQQLYGVQVSLLRAADGTGAAFQPVKPLTQPSINN